MPIANMEAVVLSIGAPAICQTVRQGEGLAGDDLGPEAVPSDRG